MTLRLWQILSLVWLSVSAGWAYAQQTGDQIEVDGKFYILEDVVGRGGFGTAFRARNRQSGVADTVIKFTEISARELMEGIVPLLSHPKFKEASPHLLPYSLPTEVTINNTRLIVQSTPLVQTFNGPMEATTDRYSKLLKFAYEGLAAIGEINDIGFVHRDIKPGNMGLLNGRLVFFDYDIATPQIDRAATLAGTLRYLAPESINMGQATVMTDVYAFGCSLVDLMFSREAVDPTRTSFGNGSAFSEFNAKAMMMRDQATYETKYYRHIRELLEANLADLDSTSPNYSNEQQSLKTLNRLILGALEWDPGKRADLFEGEENIPTKLRGSLERYRRPSSPVQPDSTCNLHARGFSMSDDVTQVFGHNF